MPVMYTVNEVQGIFDLSNKVRVCVVASKQAAVVNATQQGILWQPAPCRVCVPANATSTPLPLKQHKYTCQTQQQALLRGVVPGSFPCALGPEPEVTAGLRRFVVIDENVNALYGQQIRQVRSVGRAGDACVLCRFVCCVASSHCPCSSSSTVRGPPQTASEPCVPVSSLSPLPSLSPPTRQPTNKHTKPTQYFAHHGVEAHLLALPTCEQNKELHLVTEIAEALEEFKVNRYGCLCLCVAVQGCVLLALHGCPGV